MVKSRRSLRPAPTSLQHVQRNAPEVAELLLRIHENIMPVKPALKSHIRHEFATPVKAKVKATSKRPAAPGKENKVKTVLEKGVQAKGRSLSQGQTAVNHNSGAVPTAHVFPNPAPSSTTTTVTNGNHWAEPTLSDTRTSLSNGVYNGSYGNASRDHSMLSGSQTNESLFRPSLSTITGRASDSEFHTLIQDPDQTVNHSRFLDRDIFAAAPSSERDLSVFSERSNSDVMRDSRVRVTSSHEGSDISRTSYAHMGSAPVPQHDRLQHERMQHERVPHDRMQMQRHLDGSHMSHSSHHSLPDSISSIHMSENNMSSYNGYGNMNNHYSHQAPPKEHPGYRGASSPVPYPYERPGSGLSGPAYERPGSAMSGHISNHSQMSSFQAASFGGSFGGGGSGYPMSGMPQYEDDLAHWQLQHREQLRRQQLEASQPLYGTGSSASLTSLLTGDPHKLDSVRRAADNIIREKDNIIERQKMKIVELERTSSRKEADMQSALLHRLHDEGDQMSIKIQDGIPKESGEHQYETAALKAQMAELASHKDCSLSDLEKKLAAREYEAAELQKELEKEREKAAREIEELVAKMRDKDDLVLEWKDKHARLRDDLDDLRHKNRQLERYMEDLPTQDEQQQRTSELRTLKEDKTTLKKKCKAYEAKLKELQKNVTSRDALIQTLGETQDALKAENEALQESTTRLQAEVKRLREGGATIPEEELEELRHDNMRLTADLGKARKLLEGKHKKMQQADASHQHSVAELQERLAQEENTVIGLRDEVASKDQDLSQQRETLKLLSAENQQLLDDKFKLQDRVKEFEKQHTAEIQKYEKRLMRELGVAFRELQTLVQVCMQHAAGEDPNITALLGVKASSSSLGEFDENEPVGDNLSALKYKVSKVKELQDEVDKLRETLSDKYAEDWGQNLNCTQQ